jgi:hypothetical protein
MSSILSIRFAHFWPSATPSSSIFGALLQFSIAVYKVASKPSNTSQFSFIVCHIPSFTSPLASLVRLLLASWIDFPQICPVLQGRQRKGILRISPEGSGGRNVIVVHDCDGKI